VKLVTAPCGEVVEVGRFQSSYVKVEVALLGLVSWVRRRNWSQVRFSRRAVLELGVMAAGTWTVLSGVTSTCEVPQQRRPPPPLKYTWSVLVWRADC